MLYSLEGGPHLSVTCLQQPRHKVGTRETAATAAVAMKTRRRDDAVQAFRSPPQARNLFWMRHLREPGVLVDAAVRRLKRLMRSMCGRAVGSRGSWRRTEDGGIDGAHPDRDPYHISFVDLPIACSYESILCSEVRSSLHQK